MGLYEILGVNSSASKEEIKHAFRKKARELHPDLNHHITDDKFKEVAAAYQILMDDEKREEYNRTGIYDTSKLDITALSSEMLILFLSNLLRNTNPERLLSIDIVKQIKQQIESNTVGIKEMLDDENHRIMVIYKVKKNLKHTGDDLFILTILDEVKECTKKIIEYKNQILINNRAVEILDSYSYEPVIQTVIKDLQKNEKV
jgi:curved DNA-binding protein CbpA